ncbi:MAG: TAXI family TRAP transporter solute-binding subunit [Pseudomonadota bacterium]
MLSRIGILVLATLVVASNAFAEPVSFGSARVGSTTHSISIAIVKAMSAHSDLDVRVVPMKTPTLALLKVASGDMMVGTAGAVELDLARTGQGFFDGKIMDDLVAVGNIFPFRMMFAGRATSDANDISQLVGKSIPREFRATSTGEMLMKALLNGGGLTFESVKSVPVIGFSDSRDAFKQDRTEVMPFIVGTPQIVKMQQVVGDMKAIGFPNGPTVEARVKAVHPAFRVVDVDADPEALGQPGAMRALAYDYVLYTRKDAPDALVEALATTLIDNHEEMAKSVKAFRNLEIDRVALDVGIPFHPAAVKVYREKGLLK